MALWDESLCLGWRNRERGGAWNMGGPGEQLHKFTVFWLSVSWEQWVPVWMIFYFSNWTQSLMNNVFECINLTTVRVINKIYTYPLPKKIKAEKCFLNSKKTKIISKELKNKSDKMIKISPHRSCMTTENQD